MKITFYDFKHIRKCGDGNTRWYINIKKLLEELKIKN